MTVVSAYGGEGSSACYKSPNNGHCIYSIPLQKAMEEYGDMVLYKVVVDVFNDNNMFESNSEAVKNEIERLTEIGYTVDLNITMTEQWIIIISFFALHKCSL